MRTDPTEQRVLGIPVSWFRGGALDRRALRHPIRWSRWYIQRRRLGPYAPDFDESEVPADEP